MALFQNMGLKFYFKNIIYGLGGTEVSQFVHISVFQTSQKHTIHTFKVNFCIILPMYIHFTVLPELIDSIIGSTYADSARYQSNNLDLRL